MKVESSSLYLFCSFLLLPRLLAQEPIANLPQGRVVGIKVYTEKSLVPVEIYFGIPYATAPLGRYRFSAPERHPGWRRTLFAHRLPPQCPSDGNNENSDEDCLYLNIWTPRRVDGKSLPVAVILYSETWTRGGIHLPCQELAAEGLVVVTVSYRLHFLSLFTLKSAAARGNLGLLDQYMALLWVRDNIAAFGGDPTLITLIGHSAGADSILLHMASPRSTGLFQRAVIMSPRNIWKTLDKTANETKTETISREMARSLGCNSGDDQGILQCLRARPLSDIVSLYSKSNWSEGLEPVLDTFLPESQQYVPIHFSKVVSTEKNIKLDILLGSTDLEIINNDDEVYSKIIKQGPSYVMEYADTKIIPEALQTLSLYRPETLPLLTNAIHWEYWGGIRGDNEKEALASVEALARLQSSVKWSVGTALLAARLARRAATLYVYQYSQPAGVDLHGLQFNFTGAIHGTDLVALLGDALMLQVARRPASSTEKEISRRFRTYISNFIKYGSPSTEQDWPRYKVGGAYIHEIKNQAINNLHSSRTESAFWLQHLPSLSNLITSSERPEQLTSNNDESRLKGGVFAMCGVIISLLVLLLACIVLLHREKARRRRSSIEDVSQL